MPNASEREVRKVLQRLKSDGWQSDGGKGSHVVYRKDGMTVSVPTAKDPIPLGTYRAIEKQAGWR